MLLSVAALALLSVGAEAGSHADPFKSARHGVPMDLKLISKHVKEQRESKDSKSRNLRDEVKPHDTIYHFYRDSACTIPAHDVAQHGNICYVDTDDSTGDQSKMKLGCSVGMDGMLYHDVFMYDMMSDCAGQPLMAPMHVPFHGMPLAPGQCFPVEEGLFARVECSGKDPFRDAYGVHILHFEEHQNKDCHDHSIKTNRPHAHIFIPAGKCISMDPGESMMVEPGCGGDRRRFKLSFDENSEHCHNLGPMEEHEFERGCFMSHEDDGSPNGIEKEFCVDEMTGPQK